MVPILQGYQLVSKPAKKSGKVMSKRVALGLGSVLICSFFLTAQVPIGAPQSRQQSGMASGGAHPAVRDAQHRPITAGGFVDGAPVVFTDLTKPAGLDKFHHRSGSLEKTHIIDTPGSGVALLDYDHDGWLDIYLLNGSSVPALKDTEPAPHAMLLRNNRDGYATIVSSGAGARTSEGGVEIVEGRIKAAVAGQDASVGLLFCVPRQ
jgi:enediyne biosynthesis protein E4